MNKKALIVVRYVSFVAGALVLGMLFILIGASLFRNWLAQGPAVRAGTNWIVQPIGGPLEIRPLPSAVRLQSDFREWVQSSPGKRVRLYEVELPTNADQLNFCHRISWGDTPMGQASGTFVCFDYTDPSNGMYRFHWSHAGQQSDRWLRISKRPLKLLVQPVSLKKWPRTQVQIVGINGVEALGCLIADDGQHLMTTVNGSESFHLLIAD